MAKPISRAERLRQIADEILTLADAYDQPSRSISRAELLISECERLARSTWAVGRGGS